MIDSRFRRFAPLRAQAADRDGVDVLAPGETAAVRMSTTEYALAQLFDGRRDAGAIRAAARADLGVELSAEALEDLAAALVRQRLLQPGTHEPLPVPAHSLQPMAQPASAALVAGAALPPSTVPGGLGAPGLLGGLTGLLGARRGDAGRFLVEVDPRPLLLLGAPLIWPLHSRTALLAFGALLTVALTALLAHRIEVATSIESLLVGYRVLPAGIAAVLLVSIAGAAARAAAVARYTRERVRAGVAGGAFAVPRLFVDSAGAAERAARLDRMRIVAAGLVGTAALAVLAALLWFLSMPARPELAGAAAALFAVAVAALLIGANPLARRDGYFLLAQALDLPDLREAALYAVFGAERPWRSRAHTLLRPALVAYAAAVVAFWLAVLALLSAFGGRWLSERFGGIGFLVFATLVGGSMYRQFNKARPPRSRLGWTRDWSLSTRSRWLLGAALLLCVLPYRYQPSGEFVVLPQARADVRALVAGDVRAVLVEEGDRVHAGDVIVRLADDEQRARVAQAQAQL
ncbi:MAG: biotin/lipoyl-binding protein, partial [Gammaproteobacteria bacterium]